MTLRLYQTKTYTEDEVKELLGAPKKARLEITKKKVIRETGPTYYDRAYISTEYEFSWQLGMFEE